MKAWCSLENYTSNNTRQHETTRVQHEKTRHNTSTTRSNTRQHEYNTTKHVYNTTQHEFKGSFGSKNRALLRSFCHWTIYIFLISFRNSKYSPTCNIASTLWIPRAYNTSFQNSKQPRTCDVLRKVKRPTVYKLKLKIAIQVAKTYIYPLFRVFCGWLYTFCIYEI